MYTSNQQQTLAYVLQTRRFGLEVWAVYVTGWPHDHLIATYLCEQMARTKVMRINNKLCAMAA